jgi:hypothetical protein
MRHYLPANLAAIGRQLAATIPMMNKALDRITSVQWALGSAYAQGLRSGLVIGLCVGALIATTGVIVAWLIRQ